MSDTLAPSASDVPAEPSRGDKPTHIGVDCCLNCGAERLGDYCHGCGQHHRNDRLTLRSVWRDFAERFLKWERGLPATVRLAVLDPGRLARDYVSGRRRRYVNPVSFLLLGSALAVLLIPVYGSAERMINDTSMLGNTEESAAMSYDLGLRMAGADPASVPPEVRAQSIAEAQAMQAEFVPAYIAIVNRLYSVFSIVLALALAGMLRFLFSGRPRSDTFAETLVLGLFFAGTYAALSSLVASGIALADGPITLGLGVTTALMVVGAAWAAAGFYGRTWGNAALGALAGVIALVAYTVAIVVVALPIVFIQLA